MQRGAFIAIEGGDGAGKDTQIELLKKEFSGEEFVYTREPGGTRLGKELRAMLLHESSGAVFPGTELFLFLADRAQHVEEVVRPALEAGKTVVSNRSWVSFIAYQIAGRAQEEWRPLVEQAIAKVYAGCPLDLLIVLDIPPQVGRERMIKEERSLDVMERMSEETRERIRREFLNIAASLPNARVIDGNRTVEEVYADTQAMVRAAFSAPRV